MNVEKLFSFEGEDIIISKDKTVIEITSLLMPQFLKKAIEESFVTQAGATEVKIYDCRETYEDNGGLIENKVLFWSIEWNHSQTNRRPMIPKVAISKN